MSDLAGLLEVAANNTVSEVRLQPETLAVLLYALDKISNPKTWKDSFGEYMSDSDIELIHELVDLAADDIMRPIVIIPAGATMTWHMPTPPDNWLICNGQSVLKADWPELYAVWGNKYGSTSTHFTLLDMRDRSPLGMGTWFTGLDSVGGAFNVSLGIAEMPPHTHAAANGGNFMVNGGTGAKTHQPAAGALANYQTVTASAGGGDVHLNLHPVKSVHWIVYGGLP